MQARAVSAWDWEPACLPYFLWRAAVLEFGDGVTSYKHATTPGTLRLMFTNIRIAAAEGGDANHSEHNPLTHLLHWALRGGVIGWMGILSAMTLATWCVLLGTLWVFRVCAEF